MRRALAPLVASGARAGVFVDFDGTLSEIVPIPSRARPAEGARELLAELGRVLEVVAVVSGRSARQLLEWLGPGVEIWGVHGAERARAGGVELAPRVRPYVSLMQRVRADAEGALATRGGHGVAVEDKTIVITLHYRNAADRTEAGRLVEAVARELAARHGVATAPGRAAVELRPPVELSKAAVVRSRARDARLDAAMFIGDDSVDIPAFEALEELGRMGLAPVKVAVRSDESPPELLARADIVVEGPAGVLQLLRELLVARS
jgi:trehalose 6-phosphate phosphatase